MRNYIHLSVVLSSLLLFVACSKNNEEDILSACNADNMSFSSDIRPILDGSCAFSGCHNTSSAAAGIILDTHAGTLVVANNGNLVKSIKHEAGVSPMPKNQAKMDSCSIAKISAWVSQGALDN